MRLGCRAILLLWLLAACPLAVQAQNPETASPRSDLRYRKYYIPDTHKSEMTRGLVPVAADRVRELLNEARRRNGELPPEVQLLRARYFARFSEQQLVSGLGLLDFQSASEKTAAIPLRPVNLALGHAVWLGDEPADAVLGADRDGVHWLQVPRSGQLAVPWSLRGQASDQGRTEFSLQLPAGAVNQLILALPRGMALFSDGAVLSPWTEDLQELSAIPQAASLVDSLDSDHVLWLLELGGLSEAVVSVGPDDALPDQRAFVTLHRTSHYSLFPARLELQADVDFDVLRQTILGLTLDADPGLQLIEARYGEQAMDWVVAPRDGGAGDSYRLQFPRPLSGPNHSLRLVFHADLQVDRPWQLPAVRVADVFWQDERVELLVAESLVMELLQPTACVQTRRSPLPGGGESHEFQCFRSDYALRLQVRQRRPETTVEGGLVVRMDRELVTAHVVADVQAQWGEQFRLRAQVAKPWNVVRVDVEPAAALDTSAGSWRFENGILEIPLREPVTIGRQVRVKIDASRQAPPERIGLTGSQLQFLQFLDVDASRFLVRLYAPAPLQVSVMKDLLLERIDPAILTETELSRLGDSTEGTIFTSSSAATVTAQLAQNTPAYVADVTVEAQLEHNEVTEAFTIRCTPESLPVGRLHVRLSLRRTASPEWQLAAGGDTERLAARMIAADRNDGAADEGELWEIDLPTPLNSTFVLHGTRSWEMQNAEASIALASVPLAVSQSGRLVVRSFDPWQWKHEGLEPLPRDAAKDVDSGRDIRGVFRYQPSQTNKFHVLPRDDTTRSAWIWEARYATRVFREGRAWHEAVWRVQNEGASRFRVRFPQDVVVNTVQVDGRPMPVPGPPHTQLEIPIPKDRRFTTVSLRYVTAHDELAWMGQREFPLPQPSLPVLRAEWMLLLPSGYRALSGSKNGWLPDEPAPSLARRLLGNLAQQQGRDVTWPLTDEQRRNTSQKMDAFLSGLGELRVEPDMRWRDVAEYLASIDGAGLGDGQIWLDTESLAEAGVAPNSSINASWSAATSRQRATELLAAHGLCLVCDGRHLLLTSEKTAARWSDALEPGGNSLRLHVRPGQWLYDVFQHDLQQIAGWMSPAAWRDDSFASPWNGDHSQADLRSSGWSVTVIRLPVGTAPEFAGVPFVQTDFVRQVGWSLLLLSFSVGWWLFPWYPRAAPLALALAAATALWVPAAWTEWGAGIFLGTLAATSSLLLRPRIAGSLISASDESSRRRVLTRLSAWLLVMATAHWAKGQETPPPSSPTTSPAAAAEKSPAEFPVLIPTDVQGREVGDYWYLPRPLLDALSRNYESALRGGTWLLQSAHYQATAASQPRPSEEDRRLFVELVARLQIHTFTADQIVELPFQRSEVQFTQANLDNVPADNIRWNNTNTAIIVVVPQPGLHHLTMRLAVRRVSADADIDLALPPSARSTVTLTSIPTAWRVHVPTALGSDQSAEAGERRIEIGPASRLVIQSSLPGDMSAPPARVDELLWLRVRPNSVVLDVHLNVDSTSGRLDRITLLADPRLRLLPLTSGQPVDGEPQITEGNFQQIVLPLKPSTGPRFSVHLTFHVMGSPGVGQVRLPNVETVGMARQRRILATSRGPTLEFSNVMVEGADAFPVRDFLSAWGADPETPDAAFAIRGNAPASNQRWVATSHFAAAQTTADQHLVLQAAADRILCTLDVSLETVGGTIFRRYLEVPRNLQVSRVTLSEGTTTHELRYAVTEQKRLTLFLPAPAAARQHIVLHGHVPLRAGVAQELPMFRVLEATTASARLELVRRADVEAVELTGTDGWSRNDAVPPPPPSVGDPGRLVGSWTIPPDALERSAAEVRATPNGLRGRALLATRLMRRPEGWYADVEYHAQIRQGVLDIVRLEIPAEWEGPLVLVPALPFEIRPLPGPSRRQLLIRPPSAIARDFQVTIRGRLAGSGDRVRRAPDIVPLDLDDPLRFLVLPTRMDTQEIVWSTSRLSARPLPPLFHMAQDRRDGWESFELGERFHASIQRIERVTGFPLIRLADVRLLWSGESEYLGLASFDLEPAGTEQCVVQGAPHLQVVAAFLDDVLVPLLSEEGQRFRLSLGPPQLPQRLEFVFQGRLAEPSRAPSLRFETPWLPDFPVARTLWSVRVPWSNGELTLASPESRVTAARQELVRLETSAAIVDMAFDLAAEGGAMEADSWTRLWAERIRHSRHRLRQLQSPLNAEETRLVMERVAAMEQLWQSDTQRLGSETVASLMGSDTGVRDELQPWHHVTQREVWELHRMFQGRAPSLVAFRTGSSSDLLRRTVAALLALLMGCAATLALRRGVRLDILREYPHAVCAVLGLAWAMFLSPAVLGWLLVFVGLAAAVRSPWPKR